MAPNRHMLVYAHTGHEEALRAASMVCDQLYSSGLVPAVPPAQAESFAEHVSGKLSLLGTDVPSDEIELTIVLGGDGTILGAAELMRGSEAPLLGINHGHVGFLAERDKDDLSTAVAAAVDRDYEVDERLALDVSVWKAKELIYRGFALNEAALEKASRARMVELVLEVDGRPISAYGADGVVMATPTGSTAYSFSAGGPIVWPAVEALLMVPLSPHALFSRPLVVSPNSVMAVELLDRTTSSAILWCDGRRSVEINPGARVEVTKSDSSIRLARLHSGPFTDRLVSKFGLPVTGWRGPGKQES